MEVPLANGSSPAFVWHVSYSIANFATDILRSRCAIFYRESFHYRILEASKSGWTKISVGKVKLHVHRKDEPWKYLSLSILLPFASQQPMTDRAGSLDCFPAGDRLFYLSISSTKPSRPRKARGPRKWNGEGQYFFFRTLSVLLRDGF